MSASFDPAAAASEDAGIFGLDTQVQDAALVFVPVPFDATTSYGHGTHKGPSAILAASHQVDLFDIELGRPYEHGMAMLPMPGHIEALNTHARAAAERARSSSGAQQQQAIDAVNDASAKVNAWVQEQTATHLARGQKVATIGGDHATPFGAIAAHAQHYPQMSILHIDAHCDLRPAYEGFAHSHASIMNNVLAHTGVQKLVQVGIRDLCEQEYDMVAASGGRVVAFFDHALALRAMDGEPFVSVAGSIADALSQDVYVSFDIDGLEPSFCPNTGTPVPGGLSFREALAILRAVRNSGRRIIGFDINEVCPGKDGDTWDANVGARLCYKLAGHTLAEHRDAPKKSGRVGF